LPEDPCGRAKGADLAGLFSPLRGDISQIEPKIDLQAARMACGSMSEAFSPLFLEVRSCYLFDFNLSARPGSTYREEDGVRLRRACDVAFPRAHPINVEG
jgi:hypothetical protein